MNPFREGRGGPSWVGGVHGGRGCLYAGSDEGGTSRRRCFSPSLHTPPTSGFRAVPAALHLTRRVPGAAAFVPAPGHCTHTDTTPRLTSLDQLKLHTASIIPGVPSTPALPTSHHPAPHHLHLQALGVAPDMAEERRGPATLGLGGDDGGGGFVEEEVPDDDD